jgi:ketosteroid isomerase-like protein
MPGETEAKVRAMWARYRDTADPGFVENFDPQIEWHLAADVPDSRTLRGHEQLAEYFAGWAEAFEGLRVEPVEITEVAGRTLAVLHIQGSVRGSGREVEMDEVWVYSWRGAKVIEIREYRTKDEALQSLGSVEP